MIRETHSSHDLPQVLMTDTIKSLAVIYKTKVEWCRRSPALFNVSYVDDLVPGSSPCSETGLLFCQFGVEPLFHSVVDDLKEYLAGMANQANGAVI